MITNVTTSAATMANADHGTIHSLTTAPTLLVTAQISAMA